MKKRLIDLSVTDKLRNLAPLSLGPGHIRVAADEESSEAEVFIYGDIGGWWNGVEAAEFAKEIAALDADTINVRLNSPGGSVFDGVAIYNTLARQSSNVIVHIEGIAASIASVIAMAGDEIRIGDGSKVMIHKPWSFAMGDATVMRKEAEVLDELEAGIIDIYEARTEQKRNQLADWIAAETWFGAQGAVDNGFADTLVQAKKREKKDHAKSVMLKLFKNTPNDIVPEDREDLTGMREFEHLLRDGEGFTNSQAKRIAALAARAIQPSLRDEETAKPTQALRDEGRRADVARLKELMLSFKK
ncbi:MAG TPA: head maturation protease, ClpP-related [Burkholderiales bacterium]|nr:head maturation protease, ClpP-related [Burkholderiales bacterium]